MTPGTGGARPRVRIGVVGAGLMGRELAGVGGRWPTLVDSPVTPELTAVCDVSEPARDWFRRVASVRVLTGDHRVLLDSGEVDVIYLAVPHHLHEQLYLDTVAAGLDLLGEKPFGIDPAAAGAVVAAIESAGVFARCSSEMPYFPGAQRAYRTVASGSLGRIVEARFAFLHSSDLDPAKPGNWKRRTRTCGQIGVMGDLGMHVAHVPLRLGWLPTSVHAVLQDLVPVRPDGRGGEMPCDTIDNATLTCRVGSGAGEFPMTWETKRIAPGEMNTWSMRVLGMSGGVEFSTRHPQAVRFMRVVDGEQVWQEVQVGSRSSAPTVTGAIFEFGFADALLQMWAAYLAERAGALGEGFGCATPREALTSHLVFDAALRSAATRAEAALPPAGGPYRRHTAADVAGVLGRS
ncbi:MAG: Gfo/Idh/MocA family protein [Kineosporiaceae bacterium]